MERPSSRAPFVQGRTNKGKGKGKDKAKDKPNKPKGPVHCNRFLKDGNCTFGANCRCPHLTKEEYDRKAAEMKAASTAAPATDGAAKG